MAVWTHELTSLGVSEPREQMGSARCPDPASALTHGHLLHVLLVGNVLCH